jgi:hypothetical protein
MIHILYSPAAAGYEPFLFCKSKLRSCKSFIILRLPLMKECVTSVKFGVVKLEPESVLVTVRFILVRRQHG